MSEQLMVLHGAPTLAGIKTGSLFTSSYENKNKFMQTLRNWNQIFRKKGLCILPLRFHQNRALLYLYRQSLLENDFKNQQILKILKDNGYQCLSCQHCIAQLAKRLQANLDFPHEIGLFLGYPVEDVRGFIEQKECKYIGRWKVYDNVEESKKQFERFDQCTNTYLKHLNNGCPIELLLKKK